ncbi:MAG: ATP-binding protein [Gemmatimonadaceae bacterium]
MPLLERADQLEELDTLLRDAAAGSGCLVLAGGEAGAGKTVLVQRFAEQAQGSARVMIGACDSLSAPRPLGPLFDVSADLGRSVRRLLRDSERRWDLFAAVLDALSAGGPALFVIEDAHWADEATLDLIRFLGRRIESARALVVVTYRDDEVSLRHPLQIVLGDLATLKPVRRMKIDLLSERAVQTLTEGTGIDAGELFRKTDGNPFYVTEVIGSGAATVPLTVRDAVLTRAARLSSEGRAVLDATAVIGVQTAPWLLVTVVGDTADAVDECLAVGLLQARRESVQFRHQLAQEAVLDGISPVRRVELHQSVLAALRSRLPSAVDFTSLAHHADAAGDRDAVLEFAPIAARRAEELGAHREAAALYARALRYADGLPDAMREPLLSGWLQESAVTGNTADSLEACEKLLDIARTAHDVTKEARWLVWLGRMLIADGLNVDAEEANRSALNLLHDIPPEHVHAFAFRMQASLRMLNRDYAQAIYWGERAIVLAKRFGDTPTLVGALNAVGSARLIGGKEQQGREDLEAGLAIASDAGLDADAALYYANLGSGHGEIYQFDPAARYLSEGIDYTVARDLDGERWYMAAWLGLTRMHQGQWDTAADLAWSVVHAPGASTICKIMALIALGRVRSRRGDPDVWTALDKALDLAIPTDTLQRLAPAHAARAEAAWLIGHPERAAREARAVFDLAVQHKHQWHIGELGYWRWKAGDLHESPPGAAEPYAHQMRGDWAAAAERWSDLGCPYEAARALAESDNEAALREAFATFDRLGARPAAAMVTQRMRALGVQAIPRGLRPATRANPALLTPREVEVLELIAGDSTNADIAAHLFLSRKTVEHHVSSVLAKLEVRSRQDAVQAATELHLIQPR